MIGTTWFSRRILSEARRWTSAWIIALGILVTGLCAVSQASAKTFTIEELNGDPDYSMTVGVRGGTFLSETASWGLFRDERAALFHCPSRGSVSVSIQVDHPGLEDTQINGQDGDSMQQSIRIPNDQTYYSPQLGVGLVNFTGWKELDDDEWAFIERYFVFKLFCHKPLDVRIQNFALSFGRTVTSYKMTPRFATADDGDTIVEFTQQNWPDVGVQVVPEPPLSVIPETWARTNASGRASFKFRAAADFGPFDANGLWHPPVGIRAVKGPYELEIETGTSLPYTVVKNVSNVWYLGASGTIGDLEERLDPVDRLVPGDRVQIGSRTTTSALLDLQFINGQIVRTRSGRYGGFIATVQEGGIVEGSALLTMDVRNAVQEVRDAPRRAGRMLVYKAAGDAIDTALGIPDEVGFILPTPGGVASKYLAEYTERIYDRGPSGSNPAIEAAAAFEFFNDGSVIVENRADTFTLRDESGTGTVVRPGSSRFIPGGGAMQGLPVPPMTATGVWEAPEPGAWQITPAEGATVETPLPDVSVDNDASAAIDWSSVSVRLDGVDITPWLEPQFDFELNVLALNGTTPDKARLDHGEHTLTIDGNTRRGVPIEHRVTFSVDLSGDATAYAVARPYAAGVWLTWLPPDGASDFEIYRAATADGPYTRLDAQARQQPGFFDPDPLPENYYRIEGSYASGGAMQPLETMTAWSLAEPSAPPPEAVSGLRVEPRGDALMVRFDHSYTAATRWLLERSVDGGSFESLVPESEETIVSGFVDSTAPPGESLEYRITPVSADGAKTGTPVSASSTLPVTPAAPSGLTILRTPAGARLKWNPYSDRRADVLRVYRDAGSGFEPLSTFATTAAEYTDAGSGTGPVRYVMTALGAAESPATASLGYAFHPPANEPANIRMAATEIRPREGEGVAIVNVTRDGNLSEPAMVHFTTDGPTGGTAVAGEDYARTSGTLWFAPDQTEAEIAVELLPDAEYRWPAEQTFYVWLAMNEGLFGPSTLMPDAASTTVRIDESDVLSFPDHDLGVRAYRSDGVADIVVQRAYLSDRDISVAVVVDPSDPGDAVPGVDWVDTRPWRVSFEPGQPTAALTLELPDDAVGDRVLNLKLEDAQGGASLNESFDTLALTILDDTPPPRAAVEIIDIGHRPEDGIAPGETGCVDMDFENRGAIATTGALTLEFVPPVGFGFPAGFTLDELISSTLDMDCFFRSDPASDPTVTCTTMTSLAVGQSGSVSVALEAGWGGFMAVPFHASVGDVSRPAPDPGVCADADRSGCATVSIPVLEYLFSNGFETMTRTAAPWRTNKVGTVMGDNFESRRPACLP